MTPAGGAAAVVGAPSGSREDPCQYHQVNRELTVEEVEGGAYLLYRAGPLDGHTPNEQRGRGGIVGWR